MPSTTLLELRRKILKRLDGNDALYRDYDLNATINEYLQIVNAHCGINQDSISVPGFSVAGQFLYQIPAPILFPLQVSFEGRTLQKLSLGALARNFRQWATDATSKSGPVQHWAPIGINQFVIHPRDSLGGRDLSVTGVVEPTPLVADSDVLSIEDDFLEMAVSYCQHRLLLREGGKVFADSSLSLQEFFSLLKQRMIFQGIKAPRYWILATEPSQ